MTKYIYAVKDLVSESIVGSLIMELRDGPAIRAFHDALEPSSNSVLAKHPEDFNLLELGDIDDTGIIAGRDIPRVVATGAAWKAGAQPFEMETR